MKSEESALSPPARLAVAYARADLRAAFSLLLRFDNRITDIVGRSIEPMIAQMKIAWWHDAITASSGDRPKGEPLLIELDQIDNDTLNDAVRQLLDAWGLLLAEEQWTLEILAKFAEGRGGAVFDTYRRWIDDWSVVKDVGNKWAIDDLRLKFGSRVGASATLASQRLPNKRSLRPLTILALAATEPTGLRMTWHALTGR